MELALSAEVRLGAFCPTMDLLALVTSPDDQVCLWRLNWQKLFAFSPEAPVATLAWRPDGKILTLGHNQGVISLINVETGEAFLRSSVSEVGICCLAWAPIERLKHPAWSRQQKPKHQAAMHSLLSAAPGAPAQPAPQAALLCIIDNSGTLQLMTADLFRLAKTQLPASYAVQAEFPHQVR